MGKIVGIDLVTTNTLVAYIDPQTSQPKCIPGPYGSTLCPSVVSLDADGTVVVGEAARRRLLTQPERTIYSVKRLMGGGPADVKDELKLFPFRIEPSSKNVIRVMLGDKVFTPPEISAFILRELKNWAEAHFHHRRRYLSGSFHQWRHASGRRRHRQSAPGFCPRIDSSARRN